MLLICWEQWQVEARFVFITGDMTADKVRFGSKADHWRHHQEGLLLGVKQTEQVEKRTSKLEGLLLEEERTYWRHGPRVRF